MLQKPFKTTVCVLTLYQICCKIAKETEQAVTEEGCFSANAVMLESGPTVTR